MSDAVRVRSTRAAANGATVSLDEAILRGLAPDGGLYLPERIPPLPTDWRQATGIGDLASRVLAPWWGEEATSVAPLLRAALDFPVPLRPLPSQDLWLLELFHGPTAAFKDVGARVMARLAGRALERRGGSVTVMVATSGDTGSAVADGFAGVPNVRVALLYPKGRVSSVQERQLTMAREGVRTFAVEGTFDDCQRMVKEAFRAPDATDLNLTSANSINVGRFLPQSLYYLWAASWLQRQEGERRPPWFVVPSGNLGNVAAGLLAADMGMPAAGFVAAHNANDFLPEVLAGRLARDAVRPTVATWSNAMDVGVPSNAERLFARYGEALPAHLLAEAVDDQATLVRMRQVRDEDGLIVCPHTAVGLEVAARLRQQGRISGPIIVAATAHPAKFPDAVRAALGSEPAALPSLAPLAVAATRSEPLPADTQALLSSLRDRKAWSAAVA